MISLRSLQPEDQDWISIAIQDSEIQRWTANSGISEDDLKTWVILKDHDPAGLIALHSIDQYTSTGDVGYWIAPWARRQGVAKAALALIEKELTAIAEVETIQLKIMHDNEPSLGLARAMNFEEKATGTCSCGTQGEVVAVIFEKKL